MPRVFPERVDVVSVPRCTVPVFEQVFEHRDGGARHTSSGGPASTPGLPDGEPGESEEHVARRSADPVDVERQADAPARFRWRDRDYAVRAVLAHWVETGAWWHTATLDD